MSNRSNIFLLIFSIILSLAVSSFQFWNPVFLYPEDYLQLVGDDYLFVMLVPDQMSGMQNEQVRVYFSQSGLYSKSDLSQPIWAVDWYASRVSISDNGKYAIRWRDQPTAAVDAELFSIYDEGNLVSEITLRQMGFSRFTSGEFERITDPSRYVIDEKIENIYVLTLLPRIVKVELSTGIITSQYDVQEPTYTDFRVISMHSIEKGQTDFYYFSYLITPLNIVTVDNWPIIRFEKRIQQVDVIMIETLKEYRLSDFDLTMEALPYQNRRFDWLRAWRGLDDGTRVEITLETGDKLLFDALTGELEGEIVFEPEHHKANSIPETSEILRQLNLKYQQKEYMNRMRDPGSFIIQFSFGVVLIIIAGLVLRRLSGK